MTRTKGLHQLKLHLAGSYGGIEPGGQTTAEPGESTTDSGLVADRVSLEGKD